ncbi:FtsX-like permease family protein [Streptomyces sp. NPDC004667]|uniref:ABC transporter permease n=1 Tax=Streptomyces sp. NPDC004667 TaxID=3154285 RepID=UPI0033A1A570
MIRTALRSVVALRARFALTALATLLGVAFVCGVLIFGNTVIAGEKLMVDRGVANASVVVTANSPEAAEALGPSVVKKLETLPAIGSLRLTNSAQGEVLAKNGRYVFSNVGSFSPDENGRDPGYPITEGHAPTRRDEIAMSRTAARAAGYRLGDTVTLRLNRNPVSQKLVGLYTVPADSSPGAPVLLNSASYDTYFFVTPGHFNRMDMNPSPGVSGQELLAQVKRAVPEHAGVDVSTGTALLKQRLADVETRTEPARNLLLACSGLALFVGAFIITTTFNMLVGQRTREFALLRAIGATRRQVRQSILAEALVIGTAASVCGVPLGIGFAAGMPEALNLLGTNIPQDPLVIGPAAILGPLCMGLLVTLLGTWLPARRATRIPPVAALGSVHAPETHRSLVVRCATGGTITALGAATVAAGTAVGSAAGGRILTIGAVLVLIGVIVLTPLLARPAVALVRPLLTRRNVVTGTIACNNITRNPRRTAATASTVSIGVTMVSGLAVFGTSLGQRSGGPALIVVILNGIFAMTLLVAIVGVVNTLTISVLERQREIGLLRAVGMDGKTVKRILRIESVVISSFGAVLGVVLGAFLGRAIVSATGMTPVIPWGNLAFFVIAAAVVGRAAAAGPARRAARLDILTSIKSE